MIEPPLSALLADATRNSVGDLGPLGDAGVHTSNDHGVLILRPWPFHQPWSQDLLPTMETLHVCALALHVHFAHFLPILCPDRCHAVPQPLVLLREPPATAGPAVSLLPLSFFASLLLPIVEGLLRLYFGEGRRCERRVQGQRVRVDLQRLWSRRRVVTFAVAPALLGMRADLRHRAGRDHLSDSRPILWELLHALGMLQEAAVEQDH